MRAAALLVLVACAMAWPVAAQPVPQPVAPAPQLGAGTEPEDPTPAADPDSEGPTTDPDSEGPTPSPTADTDPDSEGPTAEPDAEPEALEPGSDLEPEPEADEPELPPEHRPSLELRLSPEAGLMTGDVLTLELRVDALAGDDIAVPQDQDFGIFEVLDRGRSSRVENGERTTHVFELELLALEPGPTEIPPIRVRVVTADQVVGEVETEARAVEVGSVLGNEPDAQPKPPTEPVEVWQEDDTLWWVLGALGLILATALATLLFARWWRRRKKAEAPPPPPRPAEEIALEKLEELRRERDRMLDAGEGEAWVDGVSDAVREYFGHRYGFEGLESTTDEVLAALRKRSVQGISIEEVAALLGDCDLVKFARADATPEQTEQMLAGAFRLVRATTPRPGAPTAPSGPAPDEVAPPAAAPAEPTVSSEEARWMPKAAPPAPADEAPADEAPADEAPADEAPADEAPADEAPADEAPAPAPAAADAPAAANATASAVAAEGSEEAAPAEPPSADARWMPKPALDAPLKSKPAAIPETMEAPSPVRDAIPKTMETPSPVRGEATADDHPDTIETPSPVRRSIPSTMPGTERLIPKTAPPPARDTDPDEGSPDGPEGEGRS